MKNYLKLISDYFVYLLVRVFICVIQSLRIETCRIIAVFMAVLANDVFGLRRKLVDKNLHESFPELSKAQRKNLTLKMWEHLFLLIAEVAHCPRVIRDSNWRKYIWLVNVNPLHDLLCKDRPLIVVTGHFGNFELGGYFLGLLGYPTFTVARTLDNPFLDKFVKQFREGTGQFIIPKNDGYDQILEVLDKRDVMAFLADQSAGRKGCWVDFFSREASAYKAIALLSLQYNAPIAVCYAIRRDGIPMQFDMKVVGIYDPLDPIPGIENVKQITQWYTSCLENGIREHPDQYWWLHDRWKTFGRLNSNRE